MSTTPGEPSLHARLQSTLNVDVLDKPDSKDYQKLMTAADLASSPVSTLKPRGTNPAPTPAHSSGSSSSGSASNPAPLPLSHSGEIRSTSSTPSRPAHRRSASAGAPLIFSVKSHGASSTSSSSANLLPAGNICPSGKIFKPTTNGSASSTSASRKISYRPDVLGSGTGNYGHGSIVRGHVRFGSAGSNGDVPGGGVVEKAMASVDPEEVKGVGNEMFRKGRYVEALKLYDRAIRISPQNAAYRANKAATLAALERLGEAVVECEEAVRLDFGYVRAHQRLAALYIR